MKIQQQEIFTLLEDCLADDTAVKKLKETVTRELEIDETTHSERSPEEKLKKLNLLKKERTEIKEISKNFSDFAAQVASIIFKKNRSTDNDDNPDCLYHNPPGALSTNFPKPNSNRLKEVAPERFTDDGHHRCGKRGPGSY